MSKPIIRGNPNINNIALTFSNGPGKITEDILDLLGRHGVKATFFFLGYRIQPDYAYNNERYISAKKVYNEGHLIGIHGLYHKDFTRLRDEELHDNLSKTIGWIQELIEEIPKYVRAPYGATDAITNNISDSLGLTTVLWSYGTWELHQNIGGYDNPCQPHLFSADDLYTQIMDQPENGSIILCYDGYKEKWEANDNLVPALERAIPELQQRFNFVRIDELLATGNWII